MFNSVVDAEVLFYIIVIISDPKNFFQRKAIRETWGQNNVIAKYPSRTIFVLGNMYDENIQNDIIVENDAYRDILQTDFKESYHNLTLKVLAAIKWIMTYCNQAKYMVRVNDEVMIDVFKMTEVLEVLIPKSTRTIAGEICYHNRVWRKTTRWAVAENDHPDIKTYPKFLNGYFYIMTMDLLSEVYRTALSIVYLWIEDVFLTGFVTKAIRNITWMDLKNHIEENEAKFIDNHKRSVHNSHFVTFTDNFYSSWTTILMTLPRKYEKSVNKRQLYNKLTRKKHYVKAWHKVN